MSRKPHKHRKPDELDLLIPESAAVRMMSKALGVDFKSVDEITAYLNEHPEKRKLLEGAR